VRALLISLFLLFSTSAFSGEFRLLNVDALNFEVTKIETKRDPYYKSHDPSEDWDWGAALNWNVRFVEYLYWSNRFHLDYDTQVRHVGWKFEAGLNCTKYFDIFWQHHSQHMLEMENKEIEFPLDDRYGIRIHFIK
jgi:hypothetical protein